MSETNALEFFKKLESYFGQKSLYNILNIDKNSSAEQLKASFYAKALNFHPNNREVSKVKIKKKEELEIELKKDKIFGMLSKIYNILDNKQTREDYDNKRELINPDIFNNEFDWYTYGLQIFRKITEEKTMNSLLEYKNSIEEREDLCHLYRKHFGNLDKIISEVKYDPLLYYDYDRIIEIIKKAINDGFLDLFDDFKNENLSKISKRKRKLFEELNHDKNYKKSKTRY